MSYARGMKRMCSVGAPEVMFAHRAGRCPECGHSSEEEDQYPEPMGEESTIRSLLRMKPAKARCRVAEEDVSGVSPLPCGCSDSYHGS